MYLGSSQCNNEKLGGAWEQGPGEEDIDNNIMVASSCSCYLSASVEGVGVVFSSGDLIIIKQTVCQETLI